jgi:phosphatidylinositol-4,5-bisphosphate 3-kinase
MMLQTGIPELRSIDDLVYMKDALALNVTEEQAKLYFRGKLQEARKKAWTTSMNWYVHGLAKDNSKI